MLRITEVKLHNICQYDDYTTAIGQGLTALCGPNGSGKSCFLRGLAYALTGIVDGSWGTQTDLQKDGTADPGYAEAAFTDGSVLYRIRRFSTSSVKFPDLLMVDGDSVTVLATRRAAVNAKMQELLGISVQLMFQICWGRQGQLDAMLTAPAAMINAFLQAVFDMKPLEKLREKIQLSIGKVAQLPDVSAALSESSSALKELPDDDPKAEEDLTVQASQLSTELAQLQASTANGMSQSEHDSRLRQLRGQLAAYDEWLRGNPRPDAEDPGMTYDELRSWRTRVEDSARRAQAELDSLASDTRQAEHDIAVYEQGVARQNDLRNAALKRLEQAAEVDKCPLCGGEIHDKGSYLRNRFRALTGFETREQLEQSYTEAVEQLNRQISECRRRIDHNAVGMPERTAALDRLRDEMSATHDTEGRIKLFEQARSYDMAVADRDRVASFVKSLEAVNVYPDDAASMLNDLAARLNATQRRLAEIRGYRQELASRRGQLEQAVATYSKMEEDRDLNNEIRRTLGELRDVFSQTRTQAIFLRSRIRAINSYIAQYMKHTQMPFSLYLNEDTHVFEYLSSEGFVHPAGHLSGAQKSMSAVVLQMAILTVVNPNMNLFLIDEPAEALDDNNKIVMAEMFERMSRLLPAIEGEMLIVTRDVQIIDSCEAVIRVGEQQ